MNERVDGCNMVAVVVVAVEVEMEVMAIGSQGHDVRFLLLCGGQR
jgi:hypothetical protein